jgi:subtilisin family serine protease
MRKIGPHLAAAAALAALLASAAPAAAAPACPPSSPAYGSGGAALGTYPSDPLFPRQWGLQQIKAPQAWARGAMGAGATIAIVDTGIDLKHPDLAGQIVDGVDLVSKQPCTPGPQDVNGHGTHVAGIAAAVTNNGIGVAGTAPLAKVMPVRVLDADGGGYDSDVVAGVRWAVAHGAQVINLSLGAEIPIAGPIGIGVPVDITGMAGAIEDAYAAGVTVIVAAGNSTYPLCSNSFTAPHAICVAATDSMGFPSSFSNFPVNPQGIAVRAPGGDGSGCGNGDIWSTYWPGAGDDGCGAKGYEPLAGTSMATPFVSGVAAMLRGAGLNNQQAIDCIKRTSSNKGSYDPVNGYGIVSADAAVAGCTTLPPPAAPTPGTTTGTSDTPTSSPGGGPPQNGVAGQRASDTIAPTIRIAIPRNGRAHAARSGYVIVRARVSERARVTFKLHSGRQTAVAGRNAIVVAGGTVTLTRGPVQAIKLRLTKAGRRVLAHRSKLTVTLLAVARDAADNRGTAIAEGRIRR